MIRAIAPCIGAPLLNTIREFASHCNLETIPNVKFIDNGGPEGIREFTSELIRQHKLDDSLYVYDLANVVRMYRAWDDALPRVTPFYAIKCNPDINILRLLKSMGAGFDCASKREMSTVMSIGTPMDRIIFAHPCKTERDIAFALEQGVGMTTFDTESELEKISTQSNHQRLGCILRIRADDPSAQVPLGLKYGADMCDIPHLLNRAKELEIRIIGVSFHVGSGAKNPDAFRDAISSSRRAFDLAISRGFEMNILDIGGGFTGRFDSVGEVIGLQELSRVINESLDAEFPEKEGVRIIAEPGRFFAETAATLFCPVTGRRVRKDTGHRDYFITDGLYGSFNCMLYDGQIPSYSVMQSAGPFQTGPISTMHPSTIWGPTCDSADVLYKDVLLPELGNGDWLMFPNMGAYTIAGACDFNGINMTRPNVQYLVSSSHVLSRFS